MPEQQETLPLAIDPAAQKFQELVAFNDWRTHAARSAIETAIRVYARCPPSNHTLVGIDAANYLQKIVPLTQEDILERHRGYGAVRWLWYLRRAPDALFEGSYGSTLGYDRLLAEMLSAQFTTNDVSSMAERVAFRVDDSAYRHLTQYVGRVKLLSQLHMLYRRVGKGAVLDARRPLLSADTTDVTERAIQIYDVRHDHSHELIGASMGLASIDPHFERLMDESSVKEPSAFLSMRCSPSFPAPVTYPNDDGKPSVVNVQIQYLLRKLNVTRILSPTGSKGGIPDYLAGTAALIQLLMLVPAICARVPWALGSIVQRGYVFVGERRLRDIFDYHLPEIIEYVTPRTPGFEWPTNFIQWRDSLLAITASLWPLSSGNVLRRSRDNFLIDTASASHALLHRIELSRSPLIGNLRAQQFELQCQDLINGTKWNPPPALKALRGRPLRQGGKVLTDIDAIGAEGQTLLIVSCKSIIYDREYDQGVFRVIQNTQTTIDQAVIAWEKVVSDLRQQPKGDNFDLSRFKEIIGMVCTPFPAFSDKDRTLAFVNTNLRACSSILEFRDWLNSNKGNEI